MLKGNDLDVTGRPRAVQLGEKAVHRIIDARFYVATYVTDWGWERAPSPVSEMLEVDQNDSVTVSIAAPRTPIICA